MHLHRSQDNIKDVGQLHRDAGQLSSNHSMQYFRDQAEQYRVKFVNSQSERTIMIQTHKNQLGDLKQELDDKHLEISHLTQQNKK